MVESALRHIRILEDLDFRLIKVSLKASDVLRTLEAYRLLAPKGRLSFPRRASPRPGRLSAGAVKSAVGLGLLLNEGLADTIRVSLTAPPEDEVRVAYQILASLGLRRRGPNIVSCPTCGRCEVDLRRDRRRGRESAGRPPRSRSTVAVMGCMVNGPGEAKEADIGVACGREAGVIFKGGKVFRRVPEKRIVAALLDGSRQDRRQRKEKRMDQDRKRPIPADSARLSSKRSRKFSGAWSKVLVAYSGGVDSTFLLKDGRRVSGRQRPGGHRRLGNVSGQGNPRGRRPGAQDAQGPASGHSHREIENPDFVENPPLRCYYCKQELFSTLKRIAGKEGIPYVLDGQNADDTGDFRPGVESRAGARASGRRLKKPALTKDDIRELSQVVRPPDLEQAFAGLPGLEVSL